MSAARQSTSVQAAEPSLDSGVAAYRRLREAIVGGAFHPNQRLVEADLTRLLSAGRTTVRAALVRLDQEGLVVRDPNRGARVRLVTDQEALEIEQVRAALERLVVRHAAERATDRDLCELRDILSEMARRVEEGDPLGYSEMNGRFHQRIWAIGDQGVASRLLANLKSQSIRFQYRTILEPGRPPRSLGEHERIVEALATRDPDAAEVAMREHLNRVVETLKKAISRKHGGSLP
ncbi:MAG: GntR family transcriptional regulator [Candidatus Dormibacter sp.]|uniref:GntR family transcriptional regulator n=1 Tax=Candidatus Dormibacter sp. TaxID=2973982 RepID=UPI003D9BEEA6